MSRDIRSITNAQVQGVSGHGHSMA